MAIKNLLKLPARRILGEFVCVVLLGFLGLFEIFGAFWITFAYPPPSRHSWEVCGIALSWVMPVVLFSGLYLLLRPTKVIAGFRLVLANIVVFCCAIIYAAFSAAIFTSGTFLVLGIWSAILTVEMFAAISLRKIATDPNDVDRPALP
jgi:hypothetical protein